MKPSADISDPRVVKALAHPLRVRILAVLEERTASPSEIAEELDAPLGNVSYHVRQLAALGFAKLVKRTPRRGAIEHHYRAEPRGIITDDAWARVPEIVKQAMVGGVLEQVSADVNGAAQAGGFSKSDAHLVRRQLVLDDKGWQALSGELGELLQRVDAIQAQSTERLESDGHQQEQQATLVTMLFESGPVPGGAVDGNKDAHRAAGGRSRRSAAAS